MKAEFFTQKLKDAGIRTLIGVPDSTLKQFCDYINGDGKNEFNHYVPANEGAAVGIACGEYLSTKRPACVYMQNSGLGNIVNPLTSLANSEVYDIPMLFVIGWRGEPGFKDEPQHKFMGKITEALLDVLSVEYSVIGKETTIPEADEIFKKAETALLNNKQYAIIVRKDTFDTRSGIKSENGYSLIREDAIAEILRSISKDDFVISTTGKISREVYEQSDIILGQHSQHFLTVGGMGHASMIAFSIAKNKADNRVICIDGDGAELMHMGSMAFIGANRPKNFVHICLNNDSHESVGGMPTGAVGQKYSDVAKACGYEKVYSAYTADELKASLENSSSQNGPVFIEAFVSLYSREDLGRPKETAIQNKENFMEFHSVK